MSKILDCHADGGEVCTTNEFGDLHAYSHRRGKGARQWDVTSPSMNKHPISQLVVVVVVVVSCWCLES